MRWQPRRIVNVTANRSEVARCPVFVSVCSNVDPQLFEGYYLASAPACVCSALSLCYRRARRHYFCTAAVDAATDRRTCPIGLPIWQGGRARSDGDTTPWIQHRPGQDTRSECNHLSACMHSRLPVGAQTREPTSARPRLVGRDSLPHTANALVCMVIMTMSICKTTSELHSCCTELSYSQIIIALVFFSNINNCWQ